MRRSQRGFVGLVRCRPQAFLTATVPSSLTAVHVVAFFLERHGAAALTVSQGRRGLNSLSHWRPAGGERAVLRPSRKARLPLLGDELASALANCSGGPSPLLVEEVALLYVLPRSWRTRSRLRERR
jgi:hypothetical protein